MGKTVTTYLIDGDPKGTQYAFISNKICQMFVVPRSNLAYLNEQEKLQNHRLISAKQKTSKNVSKTTTAKRLSGKRLLSSYQRMQI